MKMISILTAGAIALSATSLPARANGNDLLRGIATIAAVAILADQFSNGQSSRRAQPLPVHPQTGPRTTAVFPAARAFDSLSPRARLRIEDRLYGYGYLQARPDGIWDDRTWSALRAYARDAGMLNQIRDYDGALFVFHDIVS